MFMWCHCNLLHTAPILPWNNRPHNLNSLKRANSGESIVSNWTVLPALWKKHTSDRLPILASIRVVQLCKRNHNAETRNSAIVDLCAENTSNSPQKGTRVGINTGTFFIITGQFPDVKFVLNVQLDDKFKLITLNIPNNYSNYPKSFLSYYKGPALEKRDMLWTSHNAPVLSPTLLHFVTEMCICVHISVTKWCIVRYVYCIVEFVRWLYFKFFVGYMQKKSW